MNRPGPAGVVVLAMAGLAWVGALAGRFVGAPALAVGAVLLAASLARRGVPLLLASALVAGTLSGAWSIARETATLEAAVEGGHARIAGIAIDDTRSGRHGLWFLLVPTHRFVAGSWRPWNGPTLLVDSAETAVPARASVEVAGTIKPGGGRIRGDPYAARIDARGVSVGAVSNPLFSVGNAVRARILSGLDPGDPAAGLLAGFLVGDTRNVPTGWLESLRRSGLTHYVAVSGSNVALFLLLWWFVAGPLALGARRRAAIGLVGLVLFAVVTRWEPSVLRASVMAAVVLVARAVGLGLTPWVALGSSVLGLLVVSGELAVDVGFQLSVGATIGVMAGAGMFKGKLPSWLATPLGATTAAQVAVAPILLVHFGTLPLLSPLANLVAAPLVTLSTAAGGIGLLAGIPLLMRVGVGAAGAVLGVAGVAGQGPQLGWVSVGIASAVVGAVMIRPLRLVAAATAALVVIWMAMPATPLPGSVVVVFDVGQGDAILVRDRGATMLIDGGPDGRLILQKLADYRIHRIDVLVLTHPHDDHASGLVAIAERLPVGVLWHPGFRGESGPASQRLLTLAERKGIPTVVPGVGDRIRLGDVEVEVLGPRRRYASPNDQSIVLRVTSASVSVLLPGDIEARAQRELGTVRADVLKVPHQGSATSDIGWLTSVGASLAVISVGPNDFGHPSPSVVEALEGSGARVIRTDEYGDVVIPLYSPNS